MKHLLFSCLCMCVVLVGQAQCFQWNAGFEGFLDNREYNSIDNPYTIFGTRAWGELGAQVHEKHRFMVGINYLLEMGGDSRRWPDPIVYYQYSDGHLDFYLGAFSRNHVNKQPLALFSDTLNYYRPNIQGLLLNYHWEWGSQNVFIDWVSRQSDVDPEHFIFGTSGRYRRGIWSFDNYIMMAHLAAKGIPDPDYHLRDNGGLNTNLGADLSERTPLDTLYLKGGLLLSLDRIRGVDSGWQTPAGFIGQLEARYGWAGFSALYYRGQGHYFEYGDPFYRLKEYTRLDIFVVPFRSSRIQIKADVGLHFANGQLDFSQQVLVSLRVN